MTDKYPPEVMQPYHEMWRWYGWCGTTLVLTIVSVFIASPFHALRSVPFITVELALFLGAGVTYARGYRRGRDFREQARGWRSWQQTQASRPS